MNIRNKCYCALVSCLALPPGAFAQTESRVLEEVIVTANRTSESLQDVPISVTTVDGEALRDIGILNPEDLARIAPTLDVNNPGGSAQATNFAIRGVVTASFQRSIEPSVALSMLKTRFSR